MFDVLEWTGRALAAQAIACMTLYVALAAVQRFVGTAPMSVRWTGTGVAGLALLSALFHALMVVQLFTVVAAVLVLAISAGAAHRWLAPVPRVAQATAEDWARLRCFVTWRRSNLVPIAALLGTVLVAVRALLVPVVGWDSMTYHAVKAALWVQSGSYETFAAPGGWSIYRSYLGGGEALGAWAMLPFHGDTIVGIVDVLAWVLLGVSVWALGRCADLPAKQRLLACLYVLAIPAVFRAVGSLYVDNLLAMALVSGLVLSLWALHSGCRGALGLAVVAFGLATGVKVFAVPVSLLCGSMSLLLFALRWGWAQSLLPTLVGSTVASLIAVPWLLRNVALTGLPLSPLPVTLFGHTLGQPNPALTWYMARPELQGMGLRDEGLALAKMFGVPGTTPLSEPTLGLLSALVLLCGLIGLIPILRRDWRRGLLLLSFVGPLAWGYAGPGLRTTRLIWASVSGRYIVALVATLAVVALATVGRRRHLQRIADVVLGVGILSYLVLTNMHDWTLLDTLPALIVALLTLILLGLPSGWSRAVPKPLVALGVGLLALTALDAYRGATAPTMQRSSTVLHKSPRYWVAAARALDQATAEHRIAVTAGPAQDADNWFLYPLIGGRLQNQLAYIPITRSDEIPAMAQYRQLAAAADFQRWMERLKASGIDHVMSFAPTSIELQWMEQTPQLFEKVEGDGRQWGLYKLR